MTLCVDVVVENGELVALDFASHEYRIEQVVNCRTGERHPEFLAATVRPRSA